LPSCLAPAKVGLSHCHGLPAEAPDLKILVQVGNLPGVNIDHHIRPLSQLPIVTDISVVCRNPGPAISKVQYHCPPRIIARFAPIAIVWEFFTLLRLSLLAKPRCILGYLLFPHGLMAFVVAKVTGRRAIPSLIAGPVELYGGGTVRGIQFTRRLPRLGVALLKMLKHSAAVITIGSFTKAFLVGQGVEEARVYPVIGPPIPSRLRPMQSRKVYDVVSVGRLVPVKHVEVLLRATSVVKRSRSDVRVCIVGDGPCKTELLELAHELGLDDNVDFVGFQQDVVYYYSSSRVFALTSEREGLPIVFLEAIALGIPSVVTNCGDITDIARDGFNCLVIQRYDDYEGFAVAINRLLEDEQLSRKLSLNALEAAKGLSLQRATKQWEEILGNL